MSESDVQLQTEGSGPLIRTVTTVVNQPVDTAGNAVADETRHQQVVALTDSAGDVLADPNVVLSQIAAGIDRTNELLELLLETLS